MNYHLHKNFLKSYRKLSVKLKRAVDEKLSLFLRDPFSPQLDNHALTGQYNGYRSIDITGNYRAIYRPFTENEVLFVKVGTHPELYG